MSSEEKELLLKDLSARLPYNVVCDRLGSAYQLVDIDIKRGLVYLLRDESYVPYSIIRGDIVKPYLRPMSSMTEEEKVQLSQYACIGEDLNGEFIDEVQRKDCAAYIDWLNKNHFDYRGLIDKGLALVAPEGMYNLNNK